MLPESKSQSPSKQPKRKSNRPAKRRSRNKPNKPNKPKGSSVVGDILKRTAGQSDLSVRAADVLVRMALCRSVPLGQRDYQCTPCDQSSVVFNSCGERHCCRCSGFLRYQWLVRTQSLLVPRTSYLQIVFTVPNTIGDLLQYSPAAAYSMLMQTAGRETKRLQEQLNITPGCIVVLHTWNQRLLPHIHVHVLIPVAGIAIDAECWVSIADRRELSQGDQAQLGVAFRSSLIRRIKRLQKHGKLYFHGQHDHLNDPAALNKHLANIAPAGYRVFVQHAPPGCNDPATVVKYLARYVSGGPISDRRIVTAQNGKVTLLVRDNDSAAPGQRKSQTQLTLDETEFTRRWSLHILPKGFVRVRNYGHASASSRADYLSRCRLLLGIPEPDSQAEAPQNVVDEDGFEIDVAGGVSLRCPSCGEPMECVAFSFRPSWRDVLTGDSRPAWYES